MSDSKKGILKLVKGKWVRETPPPDSRSAEEIIAANLAKLEAQRVEASRKAQEERAKAAAENEKKIKASEEPASASCTVMGGKRKTRRSSRKNRKQTRRSPRKNRKQTRRS
ncbi:MAG: hypothetical protein EBT07_07880 [Actinobacteria bacterium]|nr:hypothetical protein [Actinomycetota bacterium]